MYGADSPQEAEFRSRLRGWLRERLPEGWDDRPPAPGPPDPDLARQWTAALHEAGYAGLTWPRRYGGQDLPVSFQAIFLEETAAVGAPEHLGTIGLHVVGPTLLQHGTEQQCTSYLPRILSGEVHFCLGLSEPEAGSDLATVRTRATRTGDDYLITGHKLWSSYADRATHCLLLARTGSLADRHRRLVCLLVPMSAPGVTIRPLRQATGDAGFSEILFCDVAVSQSVVVGAPDDGWRVAMTGLTCERAVLGIALAARLATQLRHLLATTRATGQADDPSVRDRLGGLAADVAGLRWTSRRVLATASRSGEEADPSIVKLRWSVTHQRLAALAVDLLGAGGPVTGPDGFWDGYWQYQELRSLGSTIEGGTSEIQRNVIAERHLGLPRSR